MILTPFQWTANSNGGLDFSSIFTQSNKSVENARNQLQTDTEALKKYSQGYKVASDKVEFFNSTMKNSSKTAQDYAANMFKTNGSVEAFTTHQIAASETLNQTTIATKAATIAGRALTIVVNTAIVALISWGINKLISCLMNMKPVSEKAQDSLKKATDNVGTANKSLNEAQSKLDSINTQIDTLKSQPALTFVEEGQLTKLEQTKTILYKDYELAQLTAKTAKIAQTQAAMQAVNTQFSTDHNTGSYDINTGKKSDWKTSMFGSMGSLQNVLDKYQQLIKQNTSESLTQADTIKQNLANLAKQYQDNANKIDGSYSEEAHDAKISAQQQVDAILSVIDKQNWLNAQFNSVWNNKSYISVENDLKHLAKQGKLTAATFKNPEFQNFAKALDGVGVSASEAANQINALVKSTKIDKDSAQNAAYSNKQLAESFKGLSQSNVKNYHNLQTILDDFKEFGQFSSEDLNSIISIFPDMSAAVMEYNAGLMSSGTLISQIKNKMESLQKSYKREIQQNLLNSSQFYSDTISKNTNLVAKLASLYGIDAKDYSTYQQLKDAITSVVSNKTIGKSADTASSLAQQYYANVKTYSDFEKAKKQVTNIVLQDIKGLNASSLAQLATIYGIDVKNFGNIEKNKLPLAKAIAEKMAQIYGVVNADFASTMKNQLKTLQTERNNLSNSLFKSPTVGSSDWYHDKIFGKSNQSSNAGKIKQIQALDSQISSMSNLIQGMNGDTFDLNKQIDKIINSVNLNIPKSNSELQKAKTAAEKAAKKAAEAAKRRAEAAKKAAEERKRALQDEYQHELNNIEAYKELDKYKSDKYGVKGLGYYKDLSALYSKWKNSSALDYSTILSLQEKIHSAHKEYEQNILDTSKQELQGRIDTGKVEENSLNHLNNIYQIQHLINSSSMSLVKTRSNQLEIEKEIYSVQKAYAQNMIDESYRQLEHRQNLGMVSGNAVLQNLLDIQRLLTHGKTAQLANTESNRWQIEEKIYDQKKQNLETDINDVDKQVQLGKLQENSIDYLNKLYAIKQQIGKSDLNAIDKASELESINEKIYSAQKSYADGIMSKSYQQLSHRQALGIQYDDRRTDDVYGDKGILQNLLDIQRLLAHGKTAQPANTEENRWQVEEKIYDQKKKILDDDEKDLDTQVQLGLIQENSFDYISKLYDIKQEIEKSDLNSIDRAEKLNEINEKIYSASKNYIEQEMQDEKEKNDNNLQAIKDQISLQEKALEQEEDAHNHNESLTDKEKAVSDIKAELTAIKNDHSDATTAKRLQLQDKLTDANKQLSNYEYSYSISQQKNELSDLSDRYDKEYKTKSKNLEKEQKAKDMALAHEVESIDRISKQILDIHSKTLNQMGSKVQSYYMNVINLTEKYNKIQNDNLNALKEFNYENNRYSDNKLSNNDHNNNKNAIPSMSNVAITPTATVNITNGDFVTTQDNLLNKMRNNLVQLGNDCIKYGQNTNVNFAEGIDNNKDATVLTTQDTLLTDMSDSIRKFIENSINYGENTDTNFSTGINNKSEEPKKSVKDIIAFLKDSESNYISDNIKYGENADINFANGIDSKAKNPIQSVTNVINSLENVDEKYVSDNSTYGKTSDNNLGNGINGNINAPKSAVSKVTNTLGQQFQSFVNSCINYGRGIDNELNAGINDAAIQKRVIATTKSLSDKVVKQFKESFGIHSPSRVMYQIGLYLIQGLINGMSAKDVQSFINSQLGNIISNITESGVSAIGHGVERWRSIAATALTLTGHYSPRNLDLLMRQMNTESGGDPNSINLWDINAKEGHPSQGLMQVIPSTFKSYAMKGYDKNILDPLSNIIAAIRYTWSRYGDAAGVWGQGHGYASGTENSTEGWANTDEKGLEYKFLPAKDGQFTWLEAGSHIIDADKVKNLELWGNLNPQTTVLRAQLTNDANRMTGAINSTINNNHTPINIDNSIHVDGGTVDEEMYQKLQGLANNTVGKTLKAMKTMRLGTGVVKPIFNV